MNDRLMNDRLMNDRLMNDRLMNELIRLVKAIPAAVPPALQEALDRIPDALQVTVLYVHSQQHGDLVTALPTVHLEDVLSKEVLAAAERLESIAVRHGGWISKVDGQHYGGTYDVAQVLQVWM